MATARNRKRTPARRGRPRSDSDDSLTARINVRFTVAQRAQLEALARHNDETLSEVVRRLTVRQLELRGN